ncbi:Hypothetical protein ABZS17I87_01596 [Kosakonia cowanii]
MKACEDNRLFINVKKYVLTRFLSTDKSQIVAKPLIMVGNYC